MTPKYINANQLERAESTRKIIKKFLECETEAQFNTVVRAYKDDISRLRLKKYVANTIKRIKAVEINHHLNNYKN